MLIGKYRLFLRKWSVLVCTAIGLIFTVLTIVFVFNGVVLWFPCLWVAVGSMFLAGTRNGMILYEMNHWHDWYGIGYKVGLMTLESLGVEFEVEASADDD